MAPKAHADLSASSAHRWMACAGSVQLSAGLPDRSSEYAREGTAAHTLLERCLNKKLDALTWLDTEIPVPYEEDGKKLIDHVTVTEEMCDAVQVCVDQVWRLIDHPQTQLFVEQRFDLAPLNPPGPMYGTSDVVIWAPFHKTLSVVDYKHGAGVAVDAAENEQLMFYGVGAAVKLIEEQKVLPETITLTIVQPRASHPDGIIRTSVLNWETLRAFKKDLFEAAEKTLQPDAPLVVGDHCRFCKALPTCPAQRQNAVEIAQTEFDAVEAPAFPAPEMLTDEQLSKVLVGGELLTEWLRAVKQYVMNKLDRGEPVSGWKLVPKRATRKWKDEAEASDSLEGLGLGWSDRHTQKLVSPAQAEKALKAIKQRLPDHLVLKESSGFNLAPESDARPALIPSAVQDFDESTPESVSESTPTEGEWQSPAPPTKTAVSASTSRRKSRKPS